MRSVHEIVEHARGTREIVEAYPIRSPVIHVLHVLHVPRMLSLEYRMRVSGSNFSGHSLPTSRADTTFFGASFTSPVLLSEYFSHYIGKYISNHPLLILSSLAHS